MIDWTDEFLVTRPGVLGYYPADVDHPVADTWYITVPLAPFSADDEYEPATFRPGAAGPTLVETEISLDSISLPATDPAALSGRAFTFPVNPEDGYIDGSVYLVATHCPVDVTRIEFGEWEGGRLRATLHACFAFDMAGAINIRDREAVLDTELRFEVARPVAGPVPGPGAGPV
ncbi:hypothetical protein ACFY4C_08875 [Actinomadura viridis]|uniref:hypothetical protein n=1 Tax=Actinomadura viridis TaxID=58110 RepID=UPI003679CE35